MKLVQELLDIKVDGHCGPKTVLTIKKFQHSLGFKKADGRIDPEGTNWENDFSDSFKQLYTSTR